MYQAINSVNGVDAVQTFLTEQNISQGPDGLEVGPPADQAVFKDVVVPDRLLAWLMDIRLLRHIPLTYLVPDAALLPTESIRFFFVDPTWVDRVIDGAFSAASTGTVELMFTCTLLKMARAKLDEEIKAAADAQAPNNWTPNSAMTGMLIRSELVRRWPDMVVEAFKGATPLPVMRAEPISRDIYIALFAGVPDKVTIAEPFSGLRFGVEPTKVANPPASQPYQVDKKGMNGTPIGSERITVPFRDNATKRVINVTSFATLGQQGAENSGRQVAINLEQKAYRQQFLTSHQEPAGSQDLPPDDTVTLHDGHRVLKLAGLRARLQAQTELKG
jgi:hypothetical protein